MDGEMDVCLEWQSTFDEQDVLFAKEEDDVYTPAVTLWAFLSQVGADASVAGST